MKFTEFKNINEAQFNSKQEVIDHFVKQGKSAAAGAAAWERGWRGHTPKKKEPRPPVRSYHDDLDDKRYGEVSEDWQKVNKQDDTDGMSPKAVKAYRRENPGSKLKTAVTKKPSELKADSKDAKRRKSFCARMSGVEGPMKDEKGRPTPKAKALSRWNCEEDIAQLDQVLEEAKKDPCWKGYKQIGMKKKGSKQVPNCVPTESIEEAALGTAPKRPARPGSRPERGHATESRYKKVTNYCDACDLPKSECVCDDEKLDEHKKGVRAHKYAKKPKGTIEQTRKYMNSPDRKVIGPQKIAQLEKEIKEAAEIMEGAKVDRMVKHIKASEKKLGHSAKEAEDIAWATVNKRGMLNNKNKKKTVAETHDPAFQRMIGNITNKEKHHIFKVVDDYTKEVGYGVEDFAYDDIDILASERLGGMDLHELADIIGFVDPIDDAEENPHSKWAGNVIDRNDPSTWPKDDLEEEQFCPDCGGSLAEAGKASRSLCVSSKADSELGASQLASCKSQGLRARDGEKSHKIGKTRTRVGGKKIKGKRYGGPLPDWS